MAAWFIISATLLSQQRNADDKRLGLVRQNVSTSHVSFRSVHRTLDVDEGKPRDIVIKPRTQQKHFRKLLIATELR